VRCCCCRRRRAGEKSSISSVVAWAASLAPRVERRDRVVGCDAGVVEDDNDELELLFFERENKASTRRCVLDGGGDDGGDAAATVRWRLRAVWWCSATLRLRGGRMISIKSLSSSSSSSRRIPKQEPSCRAARAAMAMWRCGDGDVAMAMWRWRERTKQRTKQQRRLHSLHRPLAAAAVVIVVVVVVVVFCLWRSRECYDVRSQPCSRPRCPCPRSLSNRPSHGFSSSSSQRGSSTTYVVVVVGTASISVRLYMLTPNEHHIAQCPETRQESDAVGTRVDPPAAGADHQQAAADGWRRWRHVARCMRSRPVWLPSSI